MATSDTPTHEIYAETRDRFISALDELDQEQIASAVPACPAWSIRDVVAHISGLVAEITGGAEPPYGSDEATARQVNDRSALSLDEICAEWQSNAQALVAVMQERPEVAAGLTGDLIVHVHDVYEGLDQIIDTADAATLLAARGYAARLQKRVAEQVDVALTIDFGNGELLAPPQQAANQMSLSATHFDFLRAVTGRRSRAEVLAMAWSDDATKLVNEAWRQYGKFE